MEIELEGKKDALAMAQETRSLEQLQYQKMIQKVYKWKVNNYSHH